jgi:5-methyltetrahydropteroyltriglutamate--homocysteine methyltransferase
MRSTSRIVTTHTGSLPRPESLERLILDKEAGQEIDPELEAREIRAGVEDIVARQVAAGVDWINDGEASKASYMTYHTDRLSGFESTYGGMSKNIEFFLSSGVPGLAERLHETASPAFDAVRQTVRCTGPISYVGHDLLQRDIANLKAAATGQSVEGLFISAISPGMLLTVEDEHYGDRSSFLEAIALALREEYEAIVAAGIQVQLDCPDFPGSSDDLPDRIEAINLALANIPPEMAQIHLCWGNLEVPHDTDKSLKDFVSIILESAKPGGLSIEAANPRHGHEWKVFEEVAMPEGKWLVPGVVDVKTNIVEHPELVAQRLVQYAKLIGRENVVAGTDCGFASIVNLHTVLPEVAWRKLAAMHEGAHIASRELWG